MPPRQLVKGTCRCHIQERDSVDPRGQNQRDERIPCFGKPLRQHEPDQGPLKQDSDKEDGGDNDKEVVHKERTG